MAIRHLSGLAVKVTDEDRRRGIPWDRLSCPTTAGCVVELHFCEDSTYERSTASSVTVITAGVRWTVHGEKWKEVTFTNQDECMTDSKHQFVVDYEAERLVVKPWHPSHSQR